MTADNVVGLLVAAALVAYLTAAVKYPERF
ncbi:potassium-transporting ATPase subunit F [Streptacidiphilus sp. MAP5-3]